MARHRELLERLAEEIRSGRRPGGSRLPTHRALAAREGLAVVTASKIYAELEALGLVSAEQGRGTFVRDQALPPGQGVDQHAVAADAVDLSFNRPVIPGQADLLRRGLRELAGAGDLESLLHYQPHGGRPRDRESLARHLIARGVPTTPGRVLLVDGAQHGLAVTVLAALDPGDVVAVDALTYPGFVALARATSVETAALPAGPDGPDLDALADLCARRRVRAVYTMPTVHNPLGWVTPDADRDRLVAIARAHDVVVIEDAAYAFLHDRAPRPLAARAPERVVHVSGLSKSVATGLRVGFLSAPPALVPALERAVRATTWSTPAVMTALACRWLDDGTVDDLEARKRADAARRQTIARGVFEGLPVIAHPTSYVLWLPLSGASRADRVAATLHRKRISVSTAEPFSTSARAPQALRIALGSVPLDDLARGLTEVRRAVEEEAVR